MIDERADHRRVRGVSVVSKVTLYVPHPPSCGGCCCVGRICITGDSSRLTRSRSLQPVICPELLPVDFVELDMPACVLEISACANEMMLRAMGLT